MERFNCTESYMGSSSHLKPLNVPYFKNGQFRENEPLRGYRQWVFDAVCEKYRQQVAVNAD